MYKQNNNHSSPLVIQLENSTN